MLTLLFALGFVSLTRVRIEETGCLVQWYKHYDFCDFITGYQLPMFEIPPVEKAKIVLVTTGNFGL